uniref:Uncharacterized protein n=1 Tax=Picea glauca TaxID=3330 RepID=A0A101LZT2_PICGL|nr:hypothetical protein ABT39_MTgene5386 [Picea glauca]
MRPTGSAGSLTGSIGSYTESITRSAFPSTTGGPGTASYGFPMDYTPGGYIYIYIFMDFSMYLPLLLVIHLG